MSLHNLGVTVGQKTNLIKSQKTTEGVQARITGEWSRGLDTIRKAFFWTFAKHSQEMCLTLQSGRPGQHHWERKLSSASVGLFLTAKEVAAARARGAQNLRTLERDGYHHRDLKRARMTFCCSLGMRLGQRSRIHTLPREGGLVPGGYAPTVRPSS